MRRRTKAFALRVIRVVTSLPPGRIGDVLGRQLLKSGTSIGANYAEATRASSRKQFIYLVEIATREAVETQYWLELLLESEAFSETKLNDLIAESAELAAILTATAKTARSKDSKPLVDAKKLNNK